MCRSQSKRASLSRFPRNWSRVTSSKCSRRTRRTPVQVATGSSLSVPARPSRRSNTGSRRSGATRRSLTAKRWFKVSSRKKRPNCPPPNRDQHLGAIATELGQRDSETLIASLGEGNVSIDSVAAGYTDVSFPTPVTSCFSRTSTKTIGVCTCRG